MDDFFGYPYDLYRKPPYLARGKESLAIYPDFALFGIFSGSFRGGAMELNDMIITFHSSVEVVIAFLIFNTPHMDTPI